MTKKLIIGLLLSFTIISFPGHASNKNQFGMSGAFHFDNSSLMVQGRYIRQISPKVSFVPAAAFDFDLDELVLDIDLQIINPGTRYYGLGGVNYADSDMGMNIGMGMNFNYNEKTKGFGEIKYIFFGWSGAVLNVGVYF
ncbi:hypothetical protein [Kaarinaea lacus]